MNTSTELQKRKISLIGIIGLFAGLVVAGLIGFCVYDAYKGFPEYAKKEEVYEKNKNLLNSIDKCVDESGSIFEFASALEKIAQPPSLLYLGLEIKADAKNSPFERGDEVDIIKNYKWTHRRSVIVGGTGYGTLDKKNIIIIEYKIDKFEVENCLIYLEKK
jgi:hypothetical protein